MFILGSLQCFHRAPQLNFFFLFGAVQENKYIQSRIKQIDQLQVSAVRCTIVSVPHGGTMLHVDKLFIWLCNPFSISRCSRLKFSWFLIFSRLDSEKAGRNQTRIQPRSLTSAICHCKSKRVVYNSPEQASSFFDPIFLSNVESGWLMKGVPTDADITSWISPQVVWDSVAVAGTAVCFPLSS